MSLLSSPRHVTELSSVGIVEIASATECERATQLLKEVWRSSQAPMSASLIRTVQHTGGYVYGAYDLDGSLLGVCIGLLAADSTLHSHITGIAPAGQRRGLGYQLKQHQRLWALERGMATITWTCDPIVRRNVLFNLHALGAGIQHYLPDHYGPMNDGVNNGDESDRFEIAWDLNGQLAKQSTLGRIAYLESTLPEAVSLADDGTVRVRAVDGLARRVQLPPDIEALRRADPAAAHAWRHAVRKAIVPALEQGAVISGATVTGQLVLEVPA